MRTFTGQHATQTGPRLIVTARRRFTGRHAVSTGPRVASARLRVARRKATGPGFSLADVRPGRASAAF
ncbi:hypothetical protein [Spongiactinospora sp. 9N601]|uniref:hypothetical protein n=1 Tax=Spongiactinospora sp. 9N601 TaxID=3375149 RepID=UPI0037A8C597